MKRHYLECVSSEYGVSMQLPSTVVVVVPLSILGTPYNISSIMNCSWQCWMDRIALFTFWLMLLLNTQSAAYLIPMMIILLLCQGLHVLMQWVSLTVVIIVVNAHMISGRVLSLCVDVLPSSRDSSSMMACLSSDIFCLSSSRLVCVPRRRPAVFSTEKKKQMWCCIIVIFFFWRWRDKTPCPGIQIYSSCSKMTWGINTFSLLPIGAFIV